MYKGQWALLQVKLKADISMRENGSLNGYNAAYVYDSLIAAIDPISIVQKLQEIFKLKLFGVGSLTYHLGCDYFNNMGGTLWNGPWKNFDKIMGQYEIMYGCKPSEYTSPIGKGYHPDDDCSDELDNKGTKRYQTMMGCLQ
jgi:hypothetical protein